MDLPTNLSKTQKYIDEYTSLKEEVIRYILADFGDFYDKPDYGLSLRTNFLYNNFSDDDEDIVDMYIKKRFREDFSEVAIVDTDINFFGENSLSISITFNFLEYDKNEDITLKIE